MKTSSYWSAQELVVLGVFAAAAKLSSVFIALAGGGMNPIMLIIKNLIFTTLLVVFLTKVPKPGTLLLFTAVSMLVSTLLIGGSIALVPAAFIGAILAETVLWVTGGFRYWWGPLLATALYDLGSKGISLGVAYLFFRESPEIINVVVPVVLISYLGAIAGLYSGHKSVAELKRAGFIR